MSSIGGFATGRSAVRLERRSSKFDRKHPDIFVRPAFDRMPADPEQTGASDPTSMRLAELLPFEMVLAAELALALARLASLRFAPGQLPVAWTPLSRALPPALLPGSGLPVVSGACPTRDKSANR